MHLGKSVGPSSSRNLYFFHSLLKTYIDLQRTLSPLSFFSHLLHSNLKPNDLTLSLLLKAASSSPSFLSPANSISLSKLQASQIQTHLLKLGLDQFVYVKTALLDLYLKLGRASIARRLFDEMPGRDVVTWNALICGYSRNGYDFDALGLFVEMLRQGFAPRATTFVSLLPSCGQSGLAVQGKSIHGLAIKSGLFLDLQLKNALTSMYAKCGDLESAELLFFAEMDEKGVVSWNTMISAYGQNGHSEQAMLVFKQMLEKSVDVNSVTVVSLLSANANFEAIQCFVVKTGTVNDASVIISLVCAYAKCGNAKSAELLHGCLQQENVICLTAIISSHAENGNMDLVVAYFRRMKWLDMKLDAVAIVSILHGFTNPSHMDIGLAFHGYAIKAGLSTHSLVANGLITMYSKYKDVEAIFSLFSEMDKKPLISWNSVISGCVQAGKASKAFDAFHQMRLHGLRPDTVTVSSLLSGCSQLNFLHFGKNLHNYILRNNFEKEDFVCTALIDMYAKCGNIEPAETVFKSIKDPCLATWNAMISGYSLCGLEHKPLSCYFKLQEQGLKPDKITFLGILAACTHGGLVDEGKRFFNIMIEDFGINPNLQHCTFMVGLLARVGLFQEALGFIERMDIEPDSAVWGALLSACCIHREVKIGEYVAKKMYLLDYRNGGLYVLMSNLYTAKGIWDDAARVRAMMKDTGGDGYLGVSQIE